MKRFITLILALTLLLGCAAVGTLNFSEKPQAEQLSNVLNYIESNTSITEHDDGTTEISLSPAMSNGYAAASEEILGAALATPHDYTYTKNQKHTALTVKSRYLYSLLNTSQKKYYMQIYDALNNLEAETYFDFSFEELQSSQFYFLVLLDNPELFYIGNVVSLIRNGSGSGYVFCYAASSTEYCKKGHYPEKITSTLKTKILNKRQVFNNALNSFVSTIPADAPEVVKESLIYSKILRNAYYNTNAVWNGVCEDNWNAYGILCNGYGVCESYSEIFQAACYAVGIQCIGVMGDAGGPHKWNAVNIDGDWYQCDPTFDDPADHYSTEYGLTYFNITNDQMRAAKHDWESDEWGWIVPNCYSTKHCVENIVANYGYYPDVYHTFSNQCDTTCNDCGITRYIYKHAFKSASSSVCSVCGFRRLIGWQKVGGQWYYYENEVAVKNAWRKDGKGYVYLGSSGAMVKSAWVDNSRYYVGSDGHLVTDQWVPVGSKWAFTDSEGARIRNRWKKIGGRWYYFNSSGIMKTNSWEWDSAGWHYLGKDGDMLVSSWLYDDGAWYYFDGKGNMATDTWAKDSNGWCYLGSNGKMKRNAWVRDTKGWCYIGHNGYAVTSAWKQDSTGLWCYLSSRGNMVTDEWVYYKGGWYYCDKNGYMVTGTQRIGNAKHLFSINGVWLRQL